MDEASRRKIEEGKKKLEALKAKKKAAAERSAAASVASKDAPSGDAPSGDAPSDAGGAAAPVAATPGDVAAASNAPALAAQIQPASVASSEEGDVPTLKVKLAEAEARAERLQAQALSLMQALNEQAPDGGSPAQDAARLQEQVAEKDNKVGALKIALAERDEQLDLASTQLDAMKEMMRQGGAEELGALRAQLAERDEQLELANTQLAAMKDMMRQGGAEELEALRAQLAERDEQLELANTQLEAMKDMMRSVDGAADKDEALTNLQQQLAKVVPFFLSMLVLGHFMHGILRVLATVETQRAAHQSTLAARCARQRPRMLRRGRSWRSRCDLDGAP